MSLSWQVTFLSQESYPYNGDFSLCGDLSNDVNKYNPDLIYYNKPHALANKRCRIMTWSKEAWVKKTRMERNKNTLQVTLGHTMIYYLIIVTLTKRGFFSSYFYLLPALLPLAAPPSPTLLRTESWMKENCTGVNKTQTRSTNSLGFYESLIWKDILKRIWRENRQ